MIRKQIFDKSAEYVEIYSRSVPIEFRDPINGHVEKAFIAGAKWADENQPSPWIKTDDFLPKIINNGGYSDIVLVIDENNNIELAIYSFYRGAWIRAYGNDDIDDSIIQNNITHWMKIPKLLNNNG